MKRKIVLLALVLSVIALMVGGTHAYVTVGGTATNVITTDKVSIVLQASTVTNGETVSVTPIDGVVDFGLVMPAVKVSKIVQAANVDGAEAWVRVKVDKSITLADGNEGDTDLIRIDYNTADWILGNDGWFYCKQSLKKGAQSTPLFTEVEFAKKMGNEYKKATAAVSVKVQAVQKANNGSDVMSALGWPRS